MMNGLGRHDGVGVDPDYQSLEEYPPGGIRREGVVGIAPPPPLVVVVPFGL